MIRVLNAFCWRCLLFNRWLQVVLRYWRVPRLGRWRVLVLVVHSLLLLLGAAGFAPVAACCRRIFCLRRIAARDCGRAAAKSRRTCRALAYTSASHGSSAYPLAGCRGLQARSALYSVCFAAFDFLELPAPGSATKSEPRSARTSAR